MLIQELECNEEPGMISQQYYVYYSTEGLECTNIMRVGGGGDGGELGNIKLWVLLCIQQI